MVKDDELRDVLVMVAKALQRVEKATSEPPRWYLKMTPLVLRGMRVEIEKLISGAVRRAENNLLDDVESISRRLSMVESELKLLRK